MPYPGDEDKGSLGKVVKAELKSYLRSSAARPWLEKNESDLKEAVHLFLECAYIHHDQVPKEMDPPEFRRIVMETLPRRFDGTESYLSDVPAMVASYMDYLRDAAGWKEFKGFQDVLREMEKKFTKAVKKVKKKDRIPKDESAGQIRREKGKVGRNDPCPCGSGKKYKKCCWPKVFS